MVIDACMERLFGRGFDRNGATAARGRVLEQVLRKLMRARYFSAPPPKSCGREEYGEGFVAQFIAACERASARKEDVIATATALTASTIADAYARFCMVRFGRLAPEAKVELIAAGGGVRNATLMGMLRERLPTSVRVRSIEETGLAAGAKEAAAFALLGWLTWQGLAGNLPSATGARRPVVLGKITYA
jgi:anhydro-N-acetylmuramic acid kinase